MEVTARATTTTRRGDPAEIAERLAGMRARESSPSYAVSDCLGHHHGHGCGDDALSLSSFASSDDVRAPHDDGSRDGGGGLLPSPSSSPSSRAIHGAWRERICKWCYQIVDNYDFDREVVSVAVSYLDRYFSSRPLDGPIYQLAAMTSLYLAVKLHEPRKLSAESIARLGGGTFAAAHVVAMERNLLSALGWRVHPPTPQAFSREFLRAAPPPAAAGGGDDDDDDLRDVEERARFLAELSVCDGWFAGAPPSAVGAAAALLALDLRGDAKGTSRARFLAGLDAAGTGDVVRDAVAGGCYRRLRDVHRAAGFDDDLDEGGNDENDGAVGNRTPGVIAW